MKMILKLAIFPFAACTWVNAQVVPAATGPGGPLVSGNFKYSARYSQTALFYGANNGGNQVSSITSGEVEYIHPNSRLPFNLDYSGGYMKAISGEGLGTGVFQRLAISQGIIHRRWSLMASDGVSYTPEAPTTGFSGIPGTGEPIGGTGTSSPSGESILTLNTRVLSNSATVAVAHQLNYATALTVGGGSQLLRFPDGNGMNSDGQDVIAGITRRIDARNSISAQYAYLHFSFGASAYSDGISGSFGSSSVSAEYTRTWTRRLKTDVAIGPQWTDGSDNALVPPTTGLMVRAQASYGFRAESVGVTYNHGINGTTGYVAAATVDSVLAAFSRTFGRQVTLGATGAYTRTQPLQNIGGLTDARFGGVQVSQRWGRYLTAFSSYTAVDQSSGLSGSTPQTNILNELYQVISFGVSFSPRQARLGQ